MMVVLNEYVWKATWLLVPVDSCGFWSVWDEPVPSWWDQWAFSRFSPVTKLLLMRGKILPLEDSLVLGNVYWSLRFSLIDESSLFETVNGLSCGNQSKYLLPFCREVFHDGFNHNNVGIERSRMTVTMKKLAQGWKLHSQITKRSVRKLSWPQFFSLMPTSVVST